MFNTSFHQVVSAAQDGAVTVWDPLSGIRTFQFQQTHGVLFSFSNTKIIQILTTSRVELGADLGLF
jgi:hypothetical protein